MPAANNRIFYASQSVQLQPQNADGKEIFGYVNAPDEPPANIEGDAYNYYVPQGLQSVGMTTNFALTPVFQLGQLELYDNLENVPEVEVTLNKIIDGTAPLYAMCMCGASGISQANGKELVELVNNRVNFRLGIWPDTVAATSGAATSYVDCSGMYLSRFSYTFPVDGNATEEVTLVGNNKIWNSGLSHTHQPMHTHAFDYYDDNGVEKTPTAVGIVRRYSFNYPNSLLPTGVGGIPFPSGNDGGNPYLQSITLSADLGREAIQELGSMAPYFRYVRFPLEVKSEFQIIATQGDTINADDFSANAGLCGKSYKNVLDKPVKINLCVGTGVDPNQTGSLTLDLGTKNKLTSVNYTGGDTGGGNATITYSFQTYNKFKMSMAGTFANPVFINNTDATSNPNGGDKPDTLYT